jgi:Fibronectin type III domain
VQGLIKIGGGTDGKLNATEARVARVTFRVINTTVNSNVFFENYKQDGTGETAVLKETDAGPVQLMQVNPTILTVRVSTTQVAPPAVPAQTGNTQPTGTNPANANSSSFQLLQVQNLKLTSSNQSIFVGWDPLPSADIDGYNVYYGTVSGKYIQRRSLEEDNSSLILRDLEPNTTYYVAIRAYSKKGDESTFSHEESVRVGKPESSTSPLNQQPGKISSNPPAETNPIETRNGTSITGETGLNTGVVAVILFSAAIGTALAWRRQFATSPVSSHNE